MPTKATLGEHFKIMDGRDCESEVVEFEHDRACETDAECSSRVMAPMVGAIARFASFKRGRGETQKRTPWGFASRWCPLPFADGSAPRRTRTYNPLIKSQFIDSHNSFGVSDLENGQGDLAVSLPCADSRDELESQLQILHRAWHSLPNHMRSSIMDAVKMYANDQTD
jgi:hypothetical protein